MMRENVSELISHISKLIDDNHFDEALKEIQSQKKSLLKSKQYENVSALLIDAGSGARKNSAIEEGIEMAFRALNGASGIKLISLNYNIGNAQNALYKLSGESSVVKSKHLQKSRERLQYAARLAEQERVPADLRKEIYVNLANSLSALGRRVEALDYYERVLQLDPNFGMALGNKAIALASFARITGAHEIAQAILAYSLINQVLQPPRSDELDTATQRTFEQFRKKMETRYTAKVLAQEIPTQRPSIRKRTRFEREYIKFCLSENIFMNLHIHERTHNYSVGDNMHLRLHLSHDDNSTYYQLSSYINQIKEDFAVARVLFFRSVRSSSLLERLSDLTLLAQSLGTASNVYSSLKKVSLKITFDLFDKIAGFLNEYLALGIEPEKVYFLPSKGDRESGNSIWETSAGTIRNEILKTNNESLFALYDIFRDFYSGSFSREREVRLLVTHRELTIGKSIEKPDWGPKNYFSDTELCRMNLRLMKIAKAAAIYMLNFVALEEKKKGSGGGQELVPTNQFFS